MNAAAAELGLTAPQAAVLLALAGTDAPTPSVLADTLGIDRPTMTGLLGRLERDGWVALNPHPSDGRARIVSATQKTLHAIPDIAGTSREVSDSALAGLTATERELLLALLTRVGETLHDDTERTEP